MLPALGVSRPSSARASVDLPQPDSPTRPSVSPRRQVEVDAVDGAHERAPPALVGDVEAAGLVEGVAALMAAWPAGSAPRGPSLPVSSGERALDAVGEGEVAARREAAAGEVLARVRRRARDRLAQRARPADVREARAAAAPVYGCCGDARMSRTGPCSAIWPAYMIATRSQVSAITERSCVISRSARPRSRRSSSSSCRICPCVITSSAVVGSSPIISSGPQASASAIITRWRMPPENSCGYCRRRARRDADALEQLGDARVGVRAGLVQADRLGDLPVDPHHGVERVHRALEDHRRGPPAHVAPARRRAPVQQHHAALGVERDLAARAAEAARQQSEQRERGRGLAAAGLAGQPERLAAAQAEADAVDDRDEAAFLAVDHAQVAHLEQRVAPDRRRAHARSRRVGLTISSSA